MSFLRPNGAAGAVGAVAAGAVEVFGNPQHEQHGEQHHRQTHDPHGDASAGHALGGVSI